MIFSKSSDLLLRALFTAALILTISGCSGGGENTGAGEGTGQQEAVQSLDDLKQMLNFIIESGEAGSALSGMPSQIESIPDQASRDAVMAEYKKLEAATTPDARKAAAKAMLGKL